MEGNYKKDDIEGIIKKGDMEGITKKDDMKGITKKIVQSRRGMHWLMGKI